MDYYLSHSGRKGMKWYQHIYTKAKPYVKKFAEKKFDDLMDSGSRPKKAKGDKGKSNDKKKSDKKKSDAEKTESKESKPKTKEGEGKSETKKGISADDVKKMIDSTSSLAESAKKLSEARDERLYKAKLPDKEKVKESISDMSNKDIQELLTRRKLEERYYSEIATADIEKGKSATTKFLETALPVLAVASAGVGVAGAVYKAKNKNK